MRERWVDAAIICANGHVVNASAVSYPELTTEFCEVCGAVTLRRCRACGATLGGQEQALEVAAKAITSQSIQQKHWVE